MLSRKNIYIGITVILSGMLLISCGPSEGELVATPVSLTVTPVPPSVTPVTPTVTHIPPTITPEPWDAKVHELAIGLHLLPHFNSRVMETLLGGTTVDLLAITEDQEWVQATAYLEGGSTITGWLQVDKLRLNVSLDDLTVDTETVFVPPPTHTPGPTRTPKPTEVPLGKRYVAHFVDQGFSVWNDLGVYAKVEGRQTLMVGDLENGQLVAYITPAIMTPDELTVLRELLIEASGILDPVYGWETILVALDTIDDLPFGTAYKGGREVEYQLVVQGDNLIVTYMFMNENTFFDPGAFD